MGSHFTAGAGVSSPISKRCSQFANLQQTYGNQAVLRMLRSSSAVTSSRAGGLGQRKCAKCEQEEELIKAQSGSGSHIYVNSGVEAQIQSLRGGGQALLEEIRAFFEPRFGYDFSQVRIHTDLHAANTANLLHASAFTIGQDIVFGTDKYTPKTTAGKRLLAHELTHVRQQGRLAQAKRINQPNIMRQSKPRLNPRSRTVYSIRLDFYPGKPIDAAEVLLSQVAKRRQKAGKTFALPIEELEDIFISFKIIAETIKKRTHRTKVLPFISEVHILGHGNPGAFGIGSFLYKIRDLKKLKTGRAQQYMKSNATIYLEGCNVAAGKKGKAFIQQLGRIFFGKKTGFIWGNTCLVTAPMGINLTKCKPVKYKYPNDFRKLNPQRLRRR